MVCARLLGNPTLGDLELVDAETQLARVYARWAQNLRPV